MKRTNIYLDEDQLRLLKHIAVEEGCSFTDLARQALQEFLENYQQKTKRSSAKEGWNQRLDQLLSRVRKRTSTFLPEEIEADITIAAKESRRLKSDATRSR